MEHNYPELPDFLRLSASERREAWSGKKLTKVKAFAKPAREEDATTKKLRRELKKAEAEKKKQRFALLRERYGKNK